MSILLSRLGLPLLILGCGALAWQEWRFAQATRDEPTRISCAALGRDGPGAHRHFEITDAIVCTHALATRDRNGRWASVFAPVVPIDSPDGAAILAFRAQHAESPGAKPGPPRDVRVLARLAQAESPTEVDRMAATTTLDAYVLASSSSLLSSERAALKRDLPGVDLDRCVVIEVGRAPPAWWKIVILGGIAALGALRVLVWAVGGLARRWTSARTPDRP